MISYYTFGFGFWTDFLICSFIASIYWMILFFIVFRKKIKSINYNINNTAPTSYCYTFGSFLLNVYSFVPYYNDFDWISNILRFVQVWHTISYNVIDMSHFEKGITKKVWLVHHTIPAIGAVPCMYLPWVNLSTKLFSMVEFGSFFFLMNGKYRKTSKYISLACITIIVITRLYMIYVFCQCMIYFINGEGKKGQTFEYNIMTKTFIIFWFVLFVLAIGINTYFTIQNVRNWIKIHLKKTYIDAIEHAKGTMPTVDGEMMRVRSADSEQNKEIEIVQ